MEPEIIGLGNKCPYCDSSQFSISSGGDFRPPHWSSEILGSAECRGCQRDFLVKLAPELEHAFYAWLMHNNVPRQWVKKLFP
jgi:hypothetical protein